MASIPSGALFTLKCVMKTHPFILIFSGYIISIPLFGYMLRIAELPVTRDLEDVPTYSYPNAMWNIVITIATGIARFNIHQYLTKKQHLVGYGDFYPQTTLGRIIIFFVCIWGTIVISLMVVVVTNLFQLSAPEERVCHLKMLSVANYYVSLKQMFNLLERLRLRETMKREAGAMLVSFIRGKKVSKQTGKISQTHLRKVKEHFRAFKQAGQYARHPVESLKPLFYRAYRDLSQAAKGFDEMERHFENLRDQVVYARKDISFLVGSVKTILGNSENENKGQESMTDIQRSPMVSVEKAPQPRFDQFPDKSSSGIHGKTDFFVLSH